MTLYSADVLDVAKPVAKQGKSKAVAEKPITVEKPVSKKKGKSSVPEEPEVAEIPVPKKKPTEKQLAALAKAQEGRKRKREEAAVLEPVLVEKKVKSKPKKEKPVTPPPSMDEEIDRAVEEIVRTDNKENEPPSWFKQYVAGVKKEEAKISREKKPKKQIQQEATEVAQKNWSDSFTRDRVRNEVDGHMSRMYQMMFAGRRMK